ncbi:Inclusion body clearance protein iml2 [Penicillium oxalicum]|uniref:Inclusion body clearance protein iml2 n=1 Tax=Penicillium oxalicum TaxID=69781 RepID=UPI0020B772D6|nr:Inclusion body clearance protein iml2 [Penicillium oxalicum]KAI2790129.1 Inclusion body clearance protein iml2 [Penicillium oxalicum]
MLRVGSWLYGKKAASASTQSLDSLVELKDSATFILNDDVDSAEAGLAQGTSTYHTLGKGMVAFVRATLGFEQEFMRQASERLSEAESSAANDHHRAQHRAQAPNAYRSEIYAAGSEYALCQAIAQLMGAVVGVLNESLTESIKGFYRMRKAYIALDAILKMEATFMEKKDPKRVLLKSSSDLSKISLASADIKSAHSASEVPSKPASTSAESPIIDEALSPGISGLKIGTDPDISSGPFTSGTSTPGASKIINHDPDSDIFQNEIDVFVHSGANFCFGILLLLISMVPPAFSKLLSIIGFHGDKQRGLQMLWQASKFHNIIGAMAALALLGYYNGFVRYCDIMPDPTPGEDLEIYPREKLTELLTEMRSRFPNSRLWLLEESRMKGANKNLDGALELLCTGTSSPLKQVEALCVFEKSLNALFLHNYDVCSAAFIECVDLNSWSRSLYYYIAGSCHVAQYRQLHTSDPKKAEEHAAKAREYIRKAPPLAGKKRFMARQLPFDVFVTRKIAKWEARAKEWKVDLIDAIGVDPVEEMIFFWNGHSRMTPSQLEESLVRLAWCESNENKTWPREGKEDKAILDLLRAAVLRSLHKYDEAKEVLRTKILPHEKSIFKGPLKDDWVLPAAHFEMAANVWMERPTYQSLHQVSDKPADLPAERKLVSTCKEHLDHAARWESYELDARIGLKVTAAIEAVQQWETLHPAQ